MPTVTIDPEARGGAGPWHGPLPAREDAAPERLRRTGQPPFLLHGSTIASASGVTPALPFWYELNVHRTDAGRYVSDVRLFIKAFDGSDVFRVAEHEDLAAAIGYFERYQPSADLIAPVEHAERIDRQYAAVLRELLASLLAVTD